MADFLDYCRFLTIIQNYHQNCQEISFSNFEYDFDHDFQAEQHFEFGLVSEDEKGKAPAMKPTSLLTNSVEIDRATGRECPGGIDTIT